jgi:hypothetical protein
MITDNKNVQEKNRFKRQSQRKLPILSRDDRKNKTEFKRQKQRKLPITSRGAVVMTYSERCSNLSNALFCGDGIPCKISKPRRRHNKVIQNEKTLVNNKRVRNSLRLWRKENGLTSNHGFVKNSTKVLFGDTRHLQSFDSHPFFTRFRTHASEKHSGIKRLRNFNVWRKRLSSYCSRQRRTILHTSMELTRV